MFLLFVKFMTTVMRPFEVEDLDSVLQIEQKVFPDPWSERSFLDCARWEEFWFDVALQDEKIAGYFVAQVVGKEAELHNIAVDPDHQKKGIGKKMMHHFLEKAKTAGVEDVFLMVRLSNTAAIHLYQQFGFGLLDRRKRYYQDNQEDALIFYKKMH